MKTVSSKRPIRTCIACGKSETKGGLVRFVRSKDGVVSCDASGRSAGRGAYLCADETCFIASAKRGRLNRALKCQLGTEDYERLREAFSAVCLSSRQYAQRTEEKRTEQYGSDEST